LELALQKEGILLRDGAISPLQEARLNTRDYWLATPLHGVSQDTKKVAYDDDTTPSGKKWMVRHDFAFLQCNMATQVFFIPQVSIVPQNTSIAVIGYASTLDVEDLAHKYEKDLYMPNAYSLRKVFTQFERKFVSPGTAKNRNESLLEHTANAVEW
jgi:hypothetical protein